MLKTLCLAALACAAILSARAQSTNSLSPQLEPLRPLLGKTWKGTFKQGDKPVVDVARWERALNGNAVRLLHSINDGMYGGEAIFTWDPGQRSIVYSYFTTAGFRTVGTMRLDAGKFVTRERVEGSPEMAGLEILGTSQLRPDGTFHVKTEQIKDGKVTPHHEVTYSEAPEAVVRFK